jgi:LysM repeat protein
MTPARLLAPAALVAAAIALFAVVSSGTDKSETNAGPTATATAAPTKARKKAAPEETRTSGRTYTVKPGDTPSGIAAKEHVDVDELMAANPDADASALTVGDELKLP